MVPQLPADLVSPTCLCRGEEPAGDNTAASDFFFCGKEIVVVTTSKAATYSPLERNMVRFPRPLTLLPRLRLPARP
jgi:hypothetical protein